MNIPLLKIKRLTGLFAVLELLACSVSTAADKDWRIIPG